jgi:hypothetical protein
MAKAKRWYAQSGCSMFGGCVTRKKRTRNCAEPDWICFVQNQSEQPGLHLSRTELIALLPELVWAAELLNAVAIPNEHTVPMVKRQLWQADKIVRRATDLLANEPELPVKGQK